MTTVKPHSSSSSTMKNISSRSTLSPGRRAGYSLEPPPVTLSTSLSRRLSNSRNIKGGASPAMFPVTGKKRGCGFDNPEPSSPKVTCIGQVRVKTKKKAITSLSRRRKLEHSRSQTRHLKCLQAPPQNNQKWVHIPLTICEALRSFGSEVSCLFPCRSSCSSTTEDKEKTEEESKHGAVVARWLVALHDGDGGVGRRGEIELEGGNDYEMENSRRHVFSNLEIVNDVILGSKDEARVSICVPPKNALLLMRCRSDPVMMEALTNRGWEPTLDINEEKDEDEDENEDIQLEDEKVLVLDEINDQEHDWESEEINSEVEMKQSIQEDNQDQEQSIETNEDEEEGFFLENLFEENVNQDQEIEIEEEEEEDSDMVDAVEELVEEEKIQETETGDPSIENVTQFEEEMLAECKERSESQEEEIETLNVEKFINFEEVETAVESNVKKVEQSEEEIEDIFTEFKERSEISKETHEELFEDVQETKTMESNTEKVKQSEEEFEETLTEFTEGIAVGNGENKEREKIEALPECLLLMMYEPKLSMEVSKETWVCRSDFTRSRSGRKKPPPPPPPLVKSINNCVMETVAVQSQSVPHQPVRSWCSFPASRSMIAVFGEKLVNTIGFEPLALTRCKSEPMRTVPESCCWQHQMEPPRRASFGVG